MHFEFKIERYRPKMTTENDEFENFFRQKTFPMLYGVGGGGGQNHPLWLATGQSINELENGPSLYRQKGIYFEWVFMK